MEHSINPFLTPGKHIALLIDPDKHSAATTAYILQQAGEAGVDAILVGGSLLFTRMEDALIQIRKYTKLPVWLFPGSNLQVSGNADGILLLSLISGRNPELLIGQHVIAAPAIRKAGLDWLGVGYMLIDGGAPTSVQYMSNSLPIPANKYDIAVATAMAGEMLGLRMIYLEAGSGAQKPVPREMIRAVRQAVQLPIIAGGGLREPKDVKGAFQAGANWVVLGNVTENNPDILKNLVAVKAEANSSG